MTIALRTLSLCRFLHDTAPCFLIPLTKGTYIVDALAFENHLLTTPTTSRILFKGLRIISQGISTVPSSTDVDNFLTSPPGWLTMVASWSESIGSHRASPIIPDTMSLAVPILNFNYPKVNLDHLNAFKDKTVDNFTLFKEGYIATPFHTVKVIARGELTVPLTLKVQAASKSVQAAVTKAGGTFTKTATPLKQSTKEAEKADK